MTGTLEAPISPPADEGSTPPTVEAHSTPARRSRIRATASSAAGTRASVILSVREVETLPDHGESDPSAPRTPVGETEPETEETEETGASKWLALRSWVRGNVLSACLAVALVVAVSLLTVTWISLNNDDSLNGARTSALSAARTYAGDLASYNYKHLGQDFDKVLAESTPTFKQNFTHSTEALESALSRYAASASAKVIAAGLVSATTTWAVALVFLDQTVDNTLQKNKPATTESRIEITLLRSGGRWLIDQVTLV